RKSGRWLAESSVAGEGRRLNETPCDGLGKSKTESIFLCSRSSKKTHADSTAGQLPFLGYSVLARGRWGVDLALSYRRLGWRNPGTKSAEVDLRRDGVLGRAAAHGIERYRS